MTEGTVPQRFRNATAMKKRGSEAEEGGRQRMAYLI